MNSTNKLPRNIYTLIWNIIVNKLIKSIRKVNIVIFIGPNILYYTVGTYINYM